MKIKFTDVGRNDWNGEIEIPDTNDANAIAEYAYREATKHLASSYPDVSYDLGKNEGRIYAGFHCVGNFSVIS